MVEVRSDLSAKKTSNTSHHWSLGRRNPKALRQDASIVCGAGAMPQQATVVKFFEGLETVYFAMTVHLEYLKKPKR